MITVIYTLILGSIVCIHLYKPFWIMIIDLDLPENLNCHLFWYFFCFHFLDIRDISHSVCVCVHGLIFGFVHRRCVSRHQPQSHQEYTLPSYYGKLILINHSQSREMFVKNYFDYVFGVPGINMRIYLILNILSLVPRKMSTLRRLNNNGNLCQNWSYECSITG